MAAKRPVVVANGGLQQLQVTDFLADVAGFPYLLNKAILTNGEATTLNEGEIVYIFSSGTVKRAKADNIVTAQATYITPPGGIAASAAGFFIKSGIASLSSPAAAGGTKLFLSPTTAGAVTVTCPTTAGHFVVEIGKVSITASEIELDIKSPIKLA